MNLKARLLAMTALVSASLAAGAAYAQTNTIEELVVTAEKREQSLQDVPVAISAFTSEKRDLIGINTVQDLTNFTPGLNYSTATDRISLRGVGRLTNAHPIDTAVATYSDGIYTTSTVEAGKTPIFVDRVEILRGPQGTLYGRNSIGGAINVISKRPTEDFYGEVRGTVANYGFTLLEAAVSGPLAEGLQARVAANWAKQTEGYYENIVPGMPSEGNVIDQWYAEGQLQAQMFDGKLEGWVKAAVSGWNNGGGGPGARAGYSPSPTTFGEFGAQNVSAGFACAPAGTAGPVVTNVVNASPLGCVNPAASDPRKFANRIAQTVSLDETYVIASEWVYHMDWADLKYMVGGNHYEYTLFQDNGTGAITSFQILPAAFRPTVPVAAQPCPATNAAAPGACPGLTIFPKQTSTYQEKYYNYSHELNLSSTGDGDLQWLGGLYYYKEGYDQPVFTTLHEQPQILTAPVAAAAALTGASLPPSFQRRLYDDRPTFEMESYAAYGQIDWRFAPTWKTTLGLRYSHDEKTGKESVRVLCFATTACGTTPELLGQNFTPVVDVTAGVVYLGGPAFNITPQGVVARPGSFGGVTFDSFGFATRYYSASWEAVTGTAGLQWDPDPDTMVYGRYSRGYKAGGFNSGITTTLGQFPYTDSEFIDSFEIGMKKNFGRTIQANLAIFHYDYEGLQAPLTVANNTGGLATSQSRFENVPKSISQGVELETIWAPIDGLQILFNYSYNDAHIDELTNIIDPDDPLAIAPGATPISPTLVACTGTGSTPSATNPNPNPLCDVNTGFVQRFQNLSGNSLPQAAKHKVALNVTYSWQFEGGSLTPSVSYIWRDKEYSSIFERDANASKAWDQVDLRVSWRDADNRYTIIGYVKNVFDELGYAGGAGGGRRTGTYPTGAPGVTPGLPTATPNRTNGVQVTDDVRGRSYLYALTPPRLFGLEVQYRF